MTGMRTTPCPALAAIPRSRPRYLRLQQHQHLLPPPQGPSWRGRRDRWLAHSAASPPERLEEEIEARNSFRLPYRFETGVGLFAKRTPRPFPPPFHSPPSVSFSDALSTHDRSRDRRAYVNGQTIRGQTNGDDAVYASDFFICANDGVGAWATRPRGHAGLWSRLILHFWATAIEDQLRGHIYPDGGFAPDPAASLQAAYDHTLEATGTHNWQGTTTASGAQLHYRAHDGPKNKATTTSPLLYVTNVGDCQIMVLRPDDQKVIYKTKEQWHWFDCPRQLGTNSPDTPQNDAVVDKVDLKVGDVVLAMSDGVIDNLWEHEIVESVANSIKDWENGRGVWKLQEGDRTGGRNGGMRVAAQDLMVAAKQVALDPFAESPYMEHAIEEGLASEGGKLDDISVVAALCVESEE